MRDRLVAAAEASAHVRLSMSDKEVRAALYRLGVQAVGDAILSAWAASPMEAKDAHRILALAEHWTRPTMPVGGKDVARLGVAPGPETGRLLQAFETEWIAQDFPTTGHVERLAALAAPR